VGLLSDADTFRLEVRLFNKGSTKTDYAFQSFSIAGTGAKMKMKPGFYLDTRTGKFKNKELVFTALGTSCINCHLNGPKFKSEQLVAMEKKDYAAMEGYRDFLEQMKHWSASKGQRKKIEEIMKTQGPAGLLPIDDMLKANREHWIAMYPRYLEKENTLSAAGSTTLPPATGTTASWLVGPEERGTVQLGFWDATPATAHENTPGRHFSDRGRRARLTVPG
jgi:hypothetical protein